MTHKSMKPHWDRFVISFQEGTKDFYEGHSYVNLFAEFFRLIKIPEKVIKARIPILNIGLPHIVSFLSPFGLMYIPIAFVYLKTKLGGVK